MKNIKTLEEYQKEFQRYKNLTILLIFVSFFLGVLTLDSIELANFFSPILVLSCMATVVCYLITTKCVNQAAIFYGEDLEVLSQKSNDD